MDTEKYTNALIHEASPYLLQHAHNPVQWMPWSEEAFSLARQQNKPVLLSIGYSACHWCHVMAHESFEDEATAQLMNEHFVNIKVDREERPDLDKIYQTAHQLLSQRTGGWPLTVFITPDDHVPFFAGTYFPRERRYGMPSFQEVLSSIARYYHDSSDEIRDQNASLRAALNQLNQTAAVAGVIDASPLADARAQLAADYDAEHGGFGGAPKFPHPGSLQYLLIHWFRSRTLPAADVETLDMVQTSLVKMAEGGLYDQLGGGFFRYAVDEAWMIPHFEKMLYDNGPLLFLYANCAQLTGNELFRRVCRDTAQWVMDEMQAVDGGYYSTVDADSEGEEGKYYVWTQDEVKALLVDSHEVTLVCSVFGLGRPPNFEGKWHFRIAQQAHQAGARLNLGAKESWDIFHRARRRLLQHRRQRPLPGMDSKVLTAWNALMIKGMVAASRAGAGATCLDSAERALAFIHDNLFVDGRLYACYKDGHPYQPAYLDDYAFLIDALLDYVQSRWNGVYLQWATDLMEVLLDQFAAEGWQGFYFTARDHEALIYRPRQFIDDALPSGNGIAASNLFRLGSLLGEQRYLDAGVATLKAAWPDLQRYPHACGSMLRALDLHLHSLHTIILRGQVPVLERWHKSILSGYHPGLLCLAIPDDAQDLPGRLSQYVVQDEIVAYSCRAFTCSPPYTDLEALLTQVDCARLSPSDLRE